MKIIIEKISTTKGLNTNNEWQDEKIPDDYWEHNSQTNFDKYVDNFHRSYSVINLDHPWLEEAHKIGRITFKFPKSFENELNALLDEYEGGLLSENYFVRTNSASLKTGLYGVGPYCHLKQIIISMVTSSYSHSGMGQKLYLLPWKKLDENNEFRVFVYNGRITAISQQHLYDVYENLSHASNRVLENMVNVLTNWYISYVKPRVPINSFVMDACFLTDDSIYFIEANPWGMEYGSGSSLFNWKTDYNILYGHGDPIVLRVRI